MQAYFLTPFQEHVLHRITRWCTESDRQSSRAWQLKIWSRSLKRSHEMLKSGLIQKIAYTHHCLRWHLFCLRRPSNWFLQIR